MMKDCVLGTSVVSWADDDEASPIYGGFVRYPCIGFSGPHGRGKGVYRRRLLYDYSWALGCGSFGSIWLGLAWMMLLLLQGRCV